ncbi:MAG: hypothetical protein AB1657_03915 [Candidatus Micrarchaeota archaeon]
MNNHKIMFGTAVAAGAVDSLGKKMRPRPDVRGEGAYSSIRIARVRVAELDGTEVSQNARMVMDADGKPKRLVLRGVLPDGDTVLAQAGRKAYLLTLAKVRGGKGDEFDVRYSPDRLECGLNIASAMQVGGEVREDPFSWADVLGEETQELRNALEGKASALTLRQVMDAVFRFSDGSEVKGSVLFGGNADAAPGCIKVGCGGKVKLVDALRVKGALNAFLIRGGIENLTDLGPKFVNAAENPLAFSVEIDGNRYAGLIA